MDALSDVTATESEPLADDLSNGLSDYSSRIAQSSTAAEIPVNDATSDKFGQDSTENPTTNEGENSSTNEAEDFSTNDVDYLSTNEADNSNLDEFKASDDTPVSQRESYG